MSEWVSIEDWSCRPGSDRRANAGEPSALVTSSCTGVVASGSSDAADPIALTNAGTVLVHIFVY